MIWRWAEWRLLRMARAAVLLSLLLALRCAAQPSAIGLSNPFANTPAPTNIGNCPKNVSGCCLETARQAIETCYEYQAKFKVPYEKCTLWYQTGYVTCITSCGNCTEVGLKLFDLCRFTLGRVMESGALVEAYCSMTKTDLAKYRCPAVCEPVKWDDYDQFVNEVCRSPAGLDCMSRCGNFNQCDCRVQRGSFDPVKCVGDTSYQGSVWGDATQNYSCQLTPPECMIHLPQAANYNASLGVPTGCAKYRMCPPDYCLIKRVTCIQPNQCMDHGHCGPATGLCDYYPLPTGTPCNDEWYWTVNDTCDQSVCSGVADLCLFYNVSCAINNDCVKGGTCIQHSGRCMFEHLPDGTLCNDGRDYTVEDRCQKGLCVGMYVDLCKDFGTVCTAPSACYRPGICDPKTGICSEPTPIYGTSVRCDDKDRLTVNDTCIDGTCIGHQEGMNKFLTIGKGECVDRDGRRMASYSADMPNDDACLAKCLWDAQCLGYAYAYPTCMIYGTVRTRSPQDGMNYAFISASIPPAVSIEEAKVFMTGQKVMYCRRKGYEADEEASQGAIGNLDIDKVYAFGNIGAFFFIWVTIFLLPTFIWSVYRCFCVDFTRVEDPLDSRIRDPLEMLTNFGAEAFLRTVEVVPWAVSGYQMSKKKMGTAPPVQAGPLPGEKMAIVDPISIEALEKGPGFVSTGNLERNSYYNRIGMDHMPSYPDGVCNAIQQDLECALQGYEATDRTRWCVIHVALPDLREAFNSNDSFGRLTLTLTAAYSNVLAEFAESGMPSLRLAPLGLATVDLGLLPRAFLEDLPRLTAEALVSGFGILRTELQLRLLAANSVELCIFNEANVLPFREALEERSFGHVPAPQTEDAPLALLNNSSTCKGGRLPALSYGQPLRAIAGGEEADPPLQMNVCPSQKSGG